MNEERIRFFIHRNCATTKQCSIMLQLYKSATQEKFNTCSTAWLINFFKKISITSPI